MSSAQPLTLMDLQGSQHRPLSALVDFRMPSVKNGLQTVSRRKRKYFYIR